MYVCNSGTHLSFISISLSVDRTSIHLSKHSILYCDGARLRLTITDVSRDNIRNESVISLISGRASSILIWESLPFTAHEVSYLIIVWRRRVGIKTLRRQEIRSQTTFSYDFFAADFTSTNGDCIYPCTTFYACATFYLHHNFSIKQTGRLKKGFPDRN